MSRTRTSRFRPLRARQADHLGGDSGGVVPRLRDRRAKTLSVDESRRRRQSARNRPLPSSYLAFLDRFGALGDIRQRYLREGFPPDIIVYPPQDLVSHRNHFLSALDNFGLTNKDEMRLLIPFGRDISRTYICWNPSRTRPNGEMEICFYPLEYGTPVVCGPDFRGHQVLPTVAFNRLAIGDESIVPAAIVASRPSVPKFAISPATGRSNASARSFRIRRPQRVTIQFETGGTGGG